MPGTPSDGRQKDEGTDSQEQIECNESRPLIHFLRGQLSWLLPLLVAICALTVWLMAIGTKSRDIIPPLSLAMSVLGLVIAVLVFLYQIDYPPAEDNNVSPPRSLRWRLQLRALLITIVLGGSIGLFYWAVIHRPDIPVTDQVAVSSGQGMQDGGRATIHIPGEPPKRRNLAIIPNLINTASVGDCVKPAQLDLTPVIDGQQRQSVKARPGHEARLDLAGAHHQASVLVTLHTPDLSCRVDLTVDQAVLYN